MTSPPANSGGDTSPAVSPDGHRIAFVRGPSGVGSQIYVLELGANHSPTLAPVWITSGAWSARDPTWTPDGEEIVFSGGSLHNPGLWRVRASASEKPRRIYEAGDRALQPQIAGQRLVYSQWNQDVNIWKVDATAAATGIEKKATRLIASTYIDHMPAFSPDGARVAFISNRTGAQEVWVADANESNAARVSTFPDREIFACSWSPDGRRIAFQLNNLEMAEAYAVQPDGGPPSLLVGFRGVMSPTWSRDGRWIYFRTKSGTDWGIRRIPSDSAADPARSMLMIKGGHAPSESPDGAFLYYVLDSALWRKPLPDGAEQQILRSVSYPVNYAVTQRGIFFIPQAGEGDTQSLQFLDLATKQSSVLHRFAEPVAWGLTASPDGRTVLYTRLDSAGSDLKIIGNFH